MSNPVAKIHGHACGPKLVGYINGRTLELALQIASRPTQIRSFAKTQWVEVCPVCHEGVLGSPTHKWPYRCAEGVMRTIDDFDKDSGLYTTEVLSFASFAHSQNALVSAISLQKRDQKTRDTEALGKMLLQDMKDGHAHPADIYKFSEAVHEWGGAVGKRVWANLTRHHGAQLETLLTTWLSQVPWLDVEDAVEAGSRIKGLKVSFASKHLRMLEPERFCVLDEVLSLGLGYALNPRGYKLFVDQLRVYQRVHHPSETIAFVEGGFFLLVRQDVRSVK